MNTFHKHYLIHCTVYHRVYCCSTLTQSASMFLEPIKALEGVSDGGKTVKNVNALRGTENIFMSPLQEHPETEGKKELWRKVPAEAGDAGELSFNSITFCKCIICTAILNYVGELMLLMFADSHKQTDLLL